MTKLNKVDHAYLMYSSCKFINLVSFISLAAINCVDNPLSMPRRMGFGNDIN